MKYFFKTCTTIFIVLTMVGAIYANTDRLGSSDHPLISRMQGFWIASYKESEIDSHSFRDSANNKINIEGHYYHVEYRLKKGAQAPGRVRILKHHENALKGTDAEILKRTKKDLYFKVAKEGQETWIQVHALERVYRLTIVEREQKEHKVEAKPEASQADNAINTADIHEAAKSGALDEIKALIAKGEKVNAKDDRNLTPLYYAAKAGHKEICQFLIDQGADVNAAPEPFYTPLYAALNKRNKNGVEIFKLLVERGADFNMIVGGYALLHNAALSCHDEGQRHIAEFLISKGAGINVRGYQDKTPLHMVGCKEICELLISKGADIEARDKNGRTPLFDACSRKRKEICRLLISRGADVNARNNRSWTPLRQALEKGYSEVVDILKKHGGVK
ncbi:MAG: ankyrin repeat domain-containing protein [gamma proteobacterium endosymbiont of Lamellibrachia anaximandri]|nr:ankyrin repeat domain-containing protein [gamma proteobacterium endosymbiont of Lamellibrachia anaximandri]MBL3619089.1 ankyrin repeat domain-containing protein [gamma proteobacterium endosymbiont of Lamellibrachia anaximandri]